MHDIENERNLRKAMEAGHNASEKKHNTERTHSMRKDLIKDCPDDCEEWIKGILDGIENRVNKALDLLTKIKSVDDLQNVETCKCELEQLAKDLY